MTVLIMQIAQGQQGLDPLHPRLADTDQYAGGEGNGQFPGRLDGRQTKDGILVRRAVMASALFHKSGRNAFQHDALGDRNLAQGRQIALVHDTGVQMRQQARFLEHQQGHGAQI